jgi:hypothetical protein
MRAKKLALYIGLTQKLSQTLIPTETEGEAPIAYYRGGRRFASIASERLIIPYFVRKS